MIHIKNYIGGELVAPASKQYLDNVEPATGDVYSKVPASNARDVDRAVAAAEAAFGDWSRTPMEERSRILLHLARQIECRLEEFARAESVDTGKPLSLARSMDIPRAIKNFRFFATAIVHFRSEAHPTDYAALNFTLRRPRGVVGLISPWNLPLYLLSWKVAPAISVGNTAIAKPSELTPIDGAHAERDRNRSRTPSWCAQRDTRHGSGSRRAHRRPPTHHDDLLHRRHGDGCANRGQRGTHVQETRPRAGREESEPNIVFADADFDVALQGSLRAAFANQGQICLCGSRLFVERPIYDDFVEGFVAGAKSLRIGDPLEDGTEQGALVSRGHFEKVMGYIELAREEGGTIRCGGRSAVELPDRCRRGFFIEPTVVTDLGIDCRTNQEEVFGPFVTIIPFETEEEVLALANGTPYGLSASVWTQNLSRAHRMAEGLECGTVWVNCWLFRDLRVPFGGMKHSGVGREGGEEALRFFTEPKNVCVQVPGLGVPREQEAKRGAR
jgi:aminomuconate-semialdehyde/2-hydroxymuconate-6-semialdehyde dehydrogenase